ncbi:MAG: hypothetical protein COU08_04640 [Candidatus Harrisonbacteria bacterium CG10_big_fil_rev_8_21_14_0_10_42_17]|uniref:Uncharacterized protein n=1 Tax=Candidatus Harrisonbacteria bacterium CG10_big_fil_rev_8_21_14_0_10_42_17 TaxID=1974584 RepID=A0A2M6WH49_9BACT|nr:MAG: hypothetical protein COU08_04640 [Candidatus Harrisonbacteria bacterium CG10_big_fil_rev_8_21_14_0_10_42_17]
MKQGITISLLVLISLVAMRGIGSAAENNVVIQNTVRSSANSGGNTGDSSTEAVKSETYVETIVNGETVMKVDEKTEEGTVIKSEYYESEDGRMKTTVELNLQADAERGEADQKKITQEEVDSMTEQVEAPFNTKTISAEQEGQTTPVESKKKQNKKSNSLLTLLVGYILYALGIFTV